LEFDSGCVANFTASRVSTERVRKLRFFQPHQYISIDYTRQDVIAFTVEAAPSKDYAGTGVSPVQKSDRVAQEPALSAVGGSPAVQGFDPINFMGSDLGTHPSSPNIK